MKKIIILLSTVYYQLLKKVKMKLLFANVGKVGKDIIIDPTNTIINFPQQVSLNDSVSLGSHMYINAENGNITIGKHGELLSHVILCTFHGEIVIGDNVFINHHTELLGKYGKITVGNDVLIGMHVLLITYNHGMDRETFMRKQRGIGKDIVIEDDVWIGSKVIILPGVTVGKGSVVGAGAVVTKDVAPYTIVAGNPAKVIRKRI